MYNTYITYNVCIIYMLYKHTFAPKGGGPGEAASGICKAVRESVKYSLSLSLRGEREIGSV